MLFVDHYHTNPVLVSFCHILITSHKDGKLQKTVKYRYLNQSAGNVSCLDLVLGSEWKMIPMESLDPQEAPDLLPTSLALHPFKPSCSGGIAPIIRAAWLALQTGLPTYSGTEPQNIVLGCQYTPQATQQVQFPKWRSVVGFSSLLLTGSPLSSSCP